MPLTRRPMLAALMMAGVPASGPARAQSSPCCGPVTAEGRLLARFLDSTGVDHLWPAGWHVNWETGEPDRPHPGGPAAATHCSAFVAAVAGRLGVYVLRPPEHPQELLANAQIRWLAREGAAWGWRPVSSAEQAQRLANEGALVFAAFENPDPHRPGHIAILRPSEKSAAQLAGDGPQISQAGEQNSLSMTMRNGFRHHRGAWLPGGGGGAKFFVHAVDWARLA
jgi:hypothetical protein